MSLSGKNFEEVARRSNTTTNQHDMYTGQKGYGRGASIIMRIKAMDSKIPGGLRLQISQ